MLKSLFSLLLSLSISLSKASFAFTPQVLTAQQQTYNLFLRDARKMLDEEVVSSADNRAIYAARAALLFAEATAADVDEITRKNIGLLKKLLKDIESDREQFVHHFLARIEIYIYSGMLQVRLDNRLRAASDFLSAYNLAKIAYNQYPKDAVVRLVWGNMIATIGSLPPELRKYLSIIGYTGDVQKGLQLMKSAHRTIVQQREYKPYLTKANLLYLITAKQLIDNEDVLPQNEGINPNENFCTAVVCAKVLMEQGYNEAALNLLETNKPKAGQVKLHYYHFLLGKARLAAGRAEAEQSFFTYLKDYRGKHHIKATYKLLAWHYLLKDETEKADSLMRRIPHVGQSIIGPDQQAEREANEPLNKTLIKARVFFDGGYLTEALEVLQADSALDCCQTDVEKAEYYYRLGRIYQKQGLIYLAIDAFEKAVEANSASSFSRANAALQAALLYEKIGQRDKAKINFQKCLAMRNFPYQEGLHQKAKAGLERIDSLK
ncbi:tetratricopeptide repeat protein [Thermaurantimonas aggregans]|uniref:tetratricopeptide repeat protein n=1 Tax=Thermaurantimonas aggregans TaxID=2173829 RepID=UPI0013596435|nr:tetratricopeptide repeat protein [Thermaurantimonas aggregans]MCX8148251.1 tetratricopeptide repeat protein [Thermaurantimonas aggregans]